MEGKRKYGVRNPVLSGGLRNRANLKQMRNRGIYLRNRRDADSSSLVCTVCTHMYKFDLKRRLIHSSTYRALVPNRQMSGSSLDGITVL